MKNISSYIYILGLFASFKANAFDLDMNSAATELAFSGLRPEIISSSNSLTGFSAPLGEGLNVTYNDKAILNRPVIKIEEDNSKTIREATVDEPIIINDWQVTLGESDISPIPEEILHQAIMNVEKQEKKQKEQEVIFKENNLNKESLVAFSEKSYEFPETISSFALNNISTFESQDINSLNDDEMVEGIGVISSVPALKLKEEYKEEIKQDASPPTREPPVQKRSAKKETDNSSPWAIATVRGKSSNRLAQIGNSEDFANLSINNLGNKRVDNIKENNNESNNPWASNYTPRENNKNTEISKPEDTYTPQEKINHWSIRGFNQSELNSSGLINTDYIKSYDNINNQSYSNRWVNEPKAVLINSVSSKSINKNNLKSDEASEYLEARAEKNTVNQPKKLLTKIEDNNKYEPAPSNYETSSASDSNSEFSEKTKPNSLSSHIALNEIRLNFRPNFADLSLQSIKLVSNFASRVAGDKRSVIEIRTSDKTPYLQSNRLTIIKQILISNGIEEGRINVISTDRDADTMILRFVPTSKEEAVFIKNDDRGKIKKW